MEAGVWEITQSADGMTMAFLTMSMTEMFHAFNMRSLKQSVVHMKNRTCISSVLSCVHFS